LEKIKRGIVVFIAMRDALRMNAGVLFAFWRCRLGQISRTAIFEAADGLKMRQNEELLYD
jgi:hypothetical protein